MCRKRLPSLLVDENRYVCNPCFNEAERFSKLHKDVAVLALSMRKKVSLSGEIDVVIIPADSSPSRHLQQTPGPQPRVSSQNNVLHTYIIKYNNNSKNT